MRLFKSIFASAVMMAFVFSANANNLTNPKTTDVRVEIKELIKDLDLTSYVDGEKVVKINFMLNTENEIIVLSTSDRTMDKVLKSTLNYKKVNDADIEQNKVYSIPVRLIK